MTYTLQAQSGDPGSGMGSHPGSWSSDLTRICSYAVRELVWRATLVHISYTTVATLPSGWYTHCRLKEV